jgi:hypothetical protein
MKRIRVAGPAEQDLDEIWYYIAKNSGSIDIADGVVDSITEAFSLFAHAQKPEHDVMISTQACEVSRRQTTSSITVRAVNL